MNKSIVTLIVAYTFLPAMSQAADRSAIANAAVAERTAILETAGRGSNITSNKELYQILSGVRAAVIKPGEKPQQALTRMGGGKLVETKGSYIVFSGQQSAATVTSVNGTSYPTAYNPRTGGVGIVPGNLNVKLNNSGNAAAIAADYGLEVVRVFAHLKTAFFKVKPGQDVVAVAAALTADTRVLSAEIEVIEHLNVPN